MPSHLTPLYRPGATGETLELQRRQRHIERAPIRRKITVEVTVEPEPEPPVEKKKRPTPEDPRETGAVLCVTLDPAGEFLLWRLSGTVWQLEVSEIVPANAFAGILGTRSLGREYLVSRYTNSFVQIGVYRSQDNGATFDLALGYDTEGMDGSGVAYIAKAADRRYWGHQPVDLETTDAEIVVSTTGNAGSWSNVHTLFAGSEFQELHSLACHPTDPGVVIAHYWQDTTVGLTQTTHAHLLVSEDGSSFASIALGSSWLATLPSQSAFTGVYLVRFRPDGRCYVLTRSRGVDEVATFDVYESDDYATWSPQTLATWVHDAGTAVNMSFTVGGTKIFAYVESADFVNKLFMLVGDDWIEIPVPSATATFYGYFYRTDTNTLYAVYHDEAGDGLSSARMRRPAADGTWETLTGLTDSIAGPMSVFGRTGAKL